MNKVILMGRLTKDPELRTTQSGRQVARMTLAVDRRVNRANLQPGQPTADFIGLVAWERTAEFAGTYLSKGRQILVEGRIQTGSYEAQDGTKRFTTDVIADRIEFADSRPQGDAAGGGMGSSFAPARPAAAPAPQASAPATFGNAQVTDDDIPF